MLFKALVLGHVLLASAFENKALRALQADVDTLEKTLNGGDMEKRERMIPHSDSMYAINVSTGRWKPKRNQKIAKVSRALMRKLKLSYGTRRVSVRHVRAHTGIKNNERADANAKRGVHAAPTPWPSPRPSPAPAHAQHVPRPRPPPSDPPSPRPPPEPPPSSY